MWKLTKYQNSNKTVQFDGTNLKRAKERENWKKKENLNGDFAYLSMYRFHRSWHTNVGAIHYLEMTYYKIQAANICRSFHYPDPFQSRSVGDARRVDPLQNRNGSRSIAQRRSINFGAVSFKEFQRAIIKSSPNIITSDCARPARH